MEESSTNLKAHRRFLTSCEKNVWTCTLANLHKEHKEVYLEALSKGKVRKWNEGVRRKVILIALGRISFGFVIKDVSTHSRNLETIMQNKSLFSFCSQLRIRVRQIWTFRNRHGETNREKKKRIQAFEILRNDKFLEWESYLFSSLCLCYDPESNCWLLR